MATNTIKVTVAYSDQSTKTYALPGVTLQDFNPAIVKAKINAYNVIWGCKLPDGTTVADVSGYETYIAAMRDILISADGEGIPVSIQSAQLVSEEEVTIYNG